MENLPENRSFLKYFFLSLITLGIYSLVLQSKLAKEINITAEPDEKHTLGFWAWFFLSLITGGIYGIVWTILFLIRLDTAAKAYNVECPVTITNYVVLNIVFCWTLVCPIIYEVRFFKSVNNVNAAYNEINEKAMSNASKKPKAKPIIDDDLVDA